MNGDSGASVVPPPMPGALIGHRADDGRQHTRINNRGNASVWALPIDLLPERMGETLQVRINARYA